LFFYYSLGQQMACDQTSICSIRQVVCHHRRLSLDKNPPTFKHYISASPLGSHSPQTKGSAGKPSRKQQQFVLSSFFKYLLWNKALFCFINCLHICNQLACHSKCSPVTVSFFKLSLVNLSQLRVPLWC